MTNQPFHSSETPEQTSETPIPAPYIPPPPLDRESPLRERVRTRERQRRAGADWAWVIAAVVLLGAAILIGIVILFAFRVNANLDSTAIDYAVLPTPVDARVDYSERLPLASGREVTLSDGSTIGLAPWDGETRLTLLLMGIDRRPGETGLAYRTDTMMLISLDPQRDTLGILSIPRDLWVDVPGYSALQRVNVPMVLGELQCAGCGPDLAMETIQYNLGMRVHGYAVVDFEAFTTLVDALGGIDLDVPYAIYDYEFPSMNYGYDPFFIEAGMQHLDGQTALKYARTRHTDSDFDRARRQQAVMMAIRERVLQDDTLLWLIAQSPTLLAQLTQDIHTSVSIEDVIALALYLRDLPPENIHTGVIDANYISDYTTEDGSAVLVPLRDRLTQLMIEVFGADYAG